MSQGDDIMKEKLQQIEFDLKSANEILNKQNSSLRVENDNLHEVNNGLKEENDNLRHMIRIMKSKSLFITIMLTL